jgi:hypothetical protein
MSIAAYLSKGPNGIAEVFSYTASSIQTTCHCLG